MPCNGAFRLHCWLSSKESAFNAADGGDVSLIPGLGKKTLGEGMATPLARESRGDRSLAFYSPQGCKEPRHD